MNKNDNKTVKAYTLRIDTELFTKVEQKAKENKRSIAKEIEYLLEKFYLKN